MKAVVVEIKNDSAAVLSDEGCVISIRNSNYEIGQIIQIKTPGLVLPRKIAAFTAAAAAFAVLSAGSWAYASPYAYISLDVNPSVEFTVNRFDRVLSASAVNDDAEKLLEDSSLERLKNKTIEEAIANTISEISDAGYFDQNSGGNIIIAASGKDPEKAGKLASKLQEAAENEITEHGESVIVDTFIVEQDQVAEAKKLGVTPGKLNLIEKLKKSSPNPSSVDISEWLDKSVKEISEATKQNRKAERTSPSSSTIKEQEINPSNSKNSDESNAKKVSEKIQKKEEKEIKKEKKAIEKEAQKADKTEQKAKQKKSAEKEKKKENKSKDQKEAKQQNKNLKQSEISGGNSSHSGKIGNHKTNRSKK